MLNEEIDPTACRDENLRLPAVIGEQLTSEINRLRARSRAAEAGHGLLLRPPGLPAGKSMPRLLPVLLFERLYLGFKVSHVTMHDLHHAGLQVGIVVQHRLPRR